MPVALLSSTLVHLIFSWKDWINKNNKKKKKELKCLARCIFMPEVYLKSCGNNINSLKETAML